MSRLLPLLLLTPLAVSCASPAPVGYSPYEQRGVYADELMGGQFNAHVGQRSYDDTANWGRLSDQVAFGINFVLAPYEKSWFNWDLSLHYADLEPMQFFGFLHVGIAYHF